MRPPGDAYPIQLARLLARIAREGASGTLSLDATDSSAGTLLFSRGVLTGLTGGQPAGGAAPSRESARRLMSVAGGRIAAPAFAAGTGDDAAAGPAPSAAAGAVTAADLALDAARLADGTAAIRDIALAGPETGLRALRTGPVCPPADPGPAARFLLVRADGSTTAARLVSESPAGEADTLRALFVLREIGMIVSAQRPGKFEDLDRFLAMTSAPGAAAGSTRRADASPPQRQPDPTPARQADPPPAPPAWTPAEQQEREALLSRCRAMASRDFYAALEVDPGATEPAIRASYYRLAKLYHPDKLRRRHLLDMHRDLETMFAGITEAYNTLCNDALRQEYDRLRRDVASGRRRGTDDPHAEARAIFMKGRRMMDDGHTYDAIAMFEAAIQKDPSRAEYFLYLGVCQGQNPRWRKRAEESLLKAISMNPSSHLGYLELARVYRKGGLERRSLEMYAQALKWAPDNEEALEALGRAPQSRDGSPSAGILRSIFGKD